MRAALDLIAQVTYPDDPPITLTNETIDKVKNMAQTVKEMITNAFHTISKANSEVDVKNDKMTALKRFKAYYFDIYINDGKSCVNELLKSSTVSIHSDYNYREILEKWLKKYLLDLLSCYRYSVHLMMILRAAVCIECIIPPYRSTSEPASLGHRIRIRAKSASHRYSPESKYSEVCDDYALKFHIEDVKREVLLNVKTHIIALYGQLKPKYDVLATATGNACNRAVDSIHVASNICIETDAVFTSLKEMKNALREKYEKYKSKMNAWEDC